MATTHRMNKANDRSFRPLTTTTTMAHRAHSTTTPQKSRIRQDLEDGQGIRETARKWKLSHSSVIYIQDSLNDRTQKSTGRPHRVPPETMEAIKRYIDLNWETACKPWEEMMKDFGLKMQLSNISTRDAQYWTRSIHCRQNSPSEPASNATNGIIGPPNTIIPPMKTGLECYGRTNALLSLTCASNNALLAQKECDLKPANHNGRKAAKHPYASISGLVLAGITSRLLAPSQRADRPHGRIGGGRSRNAVCDGAGAQWHNARCRSSAGEQPVVRNDRQRIGARRSVACMRHHTAEWGLHRSPQRTNPRPRSQLFSINYQVISPCAPDVCSAPPPAGLSHGLTTRK